MYFNIYIDTVVEELEIVSYLFVFLKLLQPPGAHFDCITLKIGVLFMIVRKLSQPKLCNGT